MTSFRTANKCNLLLFRGCERVGNHGQLVSFMEFTISGVWSSRCCPYVRSRFVSHSGSIEDRREWDRLPITIPFFLRGRKEGGEKFLEFSTALNLCAGGVLLATRRFFEPGSKISLEIPVALANKAQLPRSISLFYATVRRCVAD